MREMREEMEVVGDLGKEEVDWESVEDLLD